MNVLSCRVVRFECDIFSGMSRYPPKTKSRSLCSSLNDLEIFYLEFYSSFHAQYILSVIDSFLVYTGSRFSWNVYFLSKYLSQNNVHRYVGEYFLYLFRIYFFSFIQTVRLLIHLGGSVGVFVICACNMICYT